MRPMLALIRACLVLLFALAATTSVLAADYVDKGKLDTLFAQLKAATSADDAHAIEQQIWSVWFNPNVADLKDRMQKAAESINDGNYPDALTQLDGIVKDYPDYSEGWNQRATLDFLMNNNDASLADIGKTLALEPRHFGAMSGRVMILLQEGNHADALKQMIAALAIDPYLNEKQLFPELSVPSTNV